MSILQFEHRKAVARMNPTIIPQALVALTCFAATAAIVMKLIP